jgi:hypothetical protein
LQTVPFFSPVATLDWFSLARSLTRSGDGVVVVESQAREARP